MFACGSSCEHIWVRLCACGRVCVHACVVSRVRVCACTCVRVCLCLREFFFFSLYIIKIWLLYKVAGKENGSKMGTRKTVTSRIECWPRLMPDPQAKSRQSECVGVCVRVCVRACVRVCLRAFVRV